MSYSVATLYISTEEIEEICVFDGPFSENWVADGYARTDGNVYWLTVSGSGRKLSARLPEGVTAPRSSHNYQAIDAAISEALTEHFNQNGQ